MNSVLGDTLSELDVGAGLILTKRAGAGLTSERRFFSICNRGVNSRTPDQFETGILPLAWSVFDRHQQAGFTSDAARGLKRPGAEFLHAVRTVFGVSIDWLLTGDGTMRGGSGIDLDLLRTIRLQIAVARAAVIDADPIAKVLLLLIRDGRLNEAVADPDLQAFLSRIAPADPDADLATELYNGHLWTEDSSAQLRNLLAAAVAHFEARKPLDKMAALARSAGPTIQINVIPSQRIAGRDYYEG